MTDERIERARLREAVRDGLFLALNETNPLHYDDAADEMADAVLALPEMAALIAGAQRANSAVAALNRVEAVLDRLPIQGPAGLDHRIRAALRGER